MTGPYEVRVGGEVVFSSPEQSLAEHIFWLHSETVEGETIELAGPAGVLDFVDEAGHPA